MNGWRTISRGLALMTTFAAGLAAEGAAPMLVEYLAMAEVDASRLSTEQAATLETIHSDPAAIDIRVGPAYPEAVRNARALSLVLPAPSDADAGTTVSFDGLRLEHRAERDYSLYYRDETSGSEVALVVLGLDVLGTIRHDGEVYRVHPLGGGLTAVYRYDTSLLPLQGGGYEAAPENQRLYRAASRHSGAATENGEATIDVLVAYTPHARAHAGNIGALIRFMFDQTNRIYANSLIRPRVRLVHSYQTEYMQADDVLTDLYRLQAPTDSFMDEVHARRDDYGADVVALLVGHRSNACGTAWIHARAEYAFTVIAQSCIGLYAFAERLGALHGARRNSDRQDNSFFPYGYGVCNDPGNWRTVMSRNPERRCPVPIPHFSNPDVSYRGTPTGEAELRNNARVINETAERLAGFRPTMPPPASPSPVIPLFMPADNPTQEGFVRIINRSNQPGTVRIHAIDDDGQPGEPVTLTLAADAAAHFNSTDLEDGNAEKGLFPGTGDGSGNWRLELDTDLDIEPRAYVRTSDGFLTSIHEVAAETDGTSMHFHVPVFNPGSNRDQQSLLRLVNIGEHAATIEISGLDDRGAEAPEGDVTLSLEAGAAYALTAQQLEDGDAEFSGRFGDGMGKWQLMVEADQPMMVMSLLQSPTGNLTNLSQ